MTDNATTAPAPPATTPATTPATPRRRRWRPPSFSVGAVLFLLACSAVAMTAGVARPKPADVDFSFLGFDPYQPKVHWHYAGLAAATLGLIVCLVDQARRAHKTGAKRLAKLGRVAYAAGLAACLVAIVLVQRGVIEDFDDAELLLFTEAYQFPQVVWYPLVIGAGLCVTTPRREPRRPSRRMEVATAAALVLVATGWALVIAFDWSTVSALVHIAIAGIETSESLRFQRPGVFPNHRAEGYFTFCCSLSAMGTLVVAVLVTRLGFLMPGPIARWACRGVAGVAVVGLAVFLWWFATDEFPRIDPDSASVGPRSTPAMLAAAAAAAAIVSLGVASRAALPFPSSQEQDTNPPSAARRGGLSRTALVTSAVCLIATGGLAIVEDFLEAFSWISFTFFGPPAATLTGLLETSAWMLKEPGSLFSIILLLIGLRVARAAWLDREPVLLEPDTKPMAEAWLWGMALATVGAPTLTIFGFCVWLSPWAIG